MTSDYFEPLEGQTEVVRNFGFMDRNRNAVFGDVVNGTVRIYFGKNKMFDFTISRNIGATSKVMARFKNLDGKQFCLNSAYIIHPDQIENVSINIPPKLDNRSNHLDIQLEAASLSKVEVGFNDISNRYVNVYFGPEDLAFVLPGNCGHEKHIERAIAIHAKMSLPLVGHGIVTQFIHDYMEQELFDGRWKDPEDILPGLLTHIGVHKYLQKP